MGGKRKYKAPGTGSSDITQELFPFLHLEEQVILLVGHAFRVSNRSNGEFSSSEVADLIEYYSLDSFKDEEIKFLRDKMVTNENKFCDTFLYHALGDPL